MADVRGVRGWAAGTLALCVAPAPLLAQATESPAGAPAPPAGEQASALGEQGRASENAVRAASDGFGVSVGRETIGIYNAGQVRGFSPTRAGNVRIEGLYFDQVWGLTGRIRRSTTIRVGLSAFGFDFPAPTGIVDYSFRKPEDTASVAVLANVNSFGAGGVEFDASVPLVKDRIALGVGAGVYRNAFYNATDSFQHIEAVSLKLTPNDRIEIVPFWARSDLYGDEAGPIYIPAGDFRPPRVPRRRYFGPDWARYRGVAINYGAFGRVDLGDDWQLRAGVFRSLFDDARAFTNLIVDLTPQGEGSQLILADPPSTLKSTSGEVRLSKLLAEGPRSHRMTVSLRGRDRAQVFDGAAVIDLGPVSIGQVLNPPRPDFAFGPQANDSVRQWFAGLSYQGQWQSVGELTLGLSYSDYRKRVDQPVFGTVGTRATPLLYNLGVAITAIAGLAIYASHTRGLEESGVAPAFALNRNEALPAIITRQSEAGLRYQISPDVRLVAGVFDLRKPYFDLDVDNVFRALGDVRNRGIELSLSGKVTGNLSIALGGVLLDPKVTGDGVRLGRLGRRPVGTPRQRLDVNLDWRLTSLPGVSIDAGISHAGRLPATIDNTVFIQARTLVSLGGAMPSISTVPLRPCGFR
ncbi:TonB-dependent receptor [Blastomonas sp.]|uniref:TonB-dependent receptor domain-containing protein n=1 Tax=Blastomonas sp. TaxID=1909299 RepID=UPI0026172725|nr:TonB-dependent receptor [Blastomonas sp.]MDM7956627.1 TonB-dependent receptor [Blastomonas sp.]